ncbi:MAG: hypothetical protein IKH75_01230 [Ruminococcus sp.]|nr:hypothetical protein [Ruminococcus sp.]
MSVFDYSYLPWDSLQELEQTAYEWDSLGTPREFSTISDANTLWDASKRTIKGTSWKESVQRFEWYILPRLTALQNALYNLEHDLPDAYYPQPGYEFMLNERGRMRPICGQIVDDRCVSHSLNDAVLIPAIRPYLIYDNTASIKNRGVDMARKRMVCHLKRYFQREGTNVGYIRLKDQSKYYDNIVHDQMREIISRFTQDILALKLVDILLKESRLDISYMTDEEYANSMNMKFNRVAYRAMNYPKLGEKWLEKGMNVGDQFSQTAGILYPYTVDFLATSVLGSRYYGRYMDDSKDMDSDLERLKARGRIIDAAADKLNMYTNERKTCIARIDKGFTYLQRKIRLLNDGNVLVRLKPIAVTRIKRRIRKLKPKVDSGKVPMIDLINMVKSWTCARRDDLTYMQLRSIELTVLKTYGREAYEQVYDHSEKWKCSQ